MAACVFEFKLDGCGSVELGEAAESELLFFAARASSLTRSASDSIFLVAFPGSAAGLSSYLSSCFPMNRAVVLGLRISPGSQATVHRSNVKFAFTENTRESPEAVKVPDHTYRGQNRHAYFAHVAIKPSGSLLAPIGCTGKRISNVRSESSRMLFRALVGDPMSHSFQTAPSSQTDPAACS